MTPTCCARSAGGARTRSSRRSTRRSPGRCSPRSPRRPRHGRSADILTRRHENRGRDPAKTRAATIADHLQLAGRDAEAAQWWWQAAQVARELYAHAEAYAHLVRALALGYPQLPGRIALGEVLVVLGRYREALAEFETAAALAGAGEGVMAADDAEADEGAGGDDRGS